MTMRSRIWTSKTNRSERGGVRSLSMIRCLGDKSSMRMIMVYQLPGNIRRQLRFETKVKAKRGGPEYYIGGCTEGYGLSVMNFLR